MSRSTAFGGPGSGNCQQQHSDWGSGRARSPGHTVPGPGAVPGPNSSHVVGRLPERHVRRKVRGCPHGAGVCVPPQDRRLPVGVLPRGHPLVSHFLTERYLRSFRPLTGQSSSCAFCRSPLGHTCKSIGFLGGGGEWGLEPPLPPQGFFRIIKNQEGGGPSPKTPSTPPQTKVTIVGKNEIYNRENLVRPFLVHQVLGPKPPPPLPPPSCSKEALPPPPPNKKRLA